LSFEYLPKILPHREGQVKEIARNLIPASKGRKPQNMFIFGPPGIGKTACIKYVFREFEDWAGIKTIYINCWSFRTPSAILSKITIELGFPVPRRGWAKDEIFLRLIEVLKKLNKGIVVCLDEADQLDKEVLYDLLRINQYVKVPFGLILISNSPYIFSNLDPRIRSSLDVEEIEFKPYSLNEMKDILRERAKEAFFSFDEAIILLAANHAIKKGGDVRVGLQALLKAGKYAEETNVNKVKVEHMRKILSKILKIKPKILEEKINETEKTILKIIGEKIWKSGELYSAYCKSVESPISKRNFRKWVNHLAQIGLIKIRKRKAGKSRLISKA
jgi:cell division control protein 6